MSAIEFIALSAVHSVVQARATLGTKWVVFKFILDAQIVCSTFLQVCLVWERLHQQHVPQDDHEQAHLFYRHWLHCEFRQE